jgi:hypothetical protein
MVGVIIIAVLFTGLSVLVAFGASKGSFRGLGAALQTTSRSGSRLLNGSMFIVYVAGIVALPLVFIIGNRENSNTQVHGVKLTAAMATGRELFADHCAVCHTLAADNAVGKIGPNLDALRPPEALILKVIASGCLQQPTAGDTSHVCLGYGTMPADIVQGRQARDIAAFVAAIAGRS